ncbi:MAG TPA: hypothetical protein VGD98_03420 [Ktedonobacteraceae bacterium]
MDTSNRMDIIHSTSNIFYTRVSQSHFTSLEEVIARLTLRHEVESLVLLGSGAEGILHPASDYDIMLVLAGMTVPISLVLTTIAQRLAEVVFFSAETLERWLTTEAGDTAKNAAPMLRRLQKARVVFDRTGRTTRLHEKALGHAWQDEHTQREVWEAWFFCNYDLQHTRRLLASSDHVYLLAVDLRLLSGISEAWKAYFLVRRVPWQGEKEALRYLADHDPDYRLLLQRCLAEAKREHKMQLYEELVKLALAPLGSLWSYDATAIELYTEGDIQPEALQTAFAWWEAALSS